MKTSYKKLLIVATLGFMPITGAQAHGVAPYFPPAEPEHRQGGESTKNHEYVKLEETRKIARDSTNDVQVIAPRISQKYESSMNSDSPGVRAPSSGSVY
jgi:hypothetical protein